MAVRGSQSYLQDMFDEPMLDPDDNVSEIAEFFAGCNVLVTGGSGFLGKLLIEKLLRSCTGIKNLYMLMRTKKGKSPEVRFKEQFEDVPPIYNVVSSCQAPITWGEYMKKNEIYGMEVPSEMVLWYYCFTLNKSLWIHNIYVFFLHLIPALIVDSLAYVTGRKPILWNAYKKIHKFSGVISYFSTQQWTFHNKRVQKLWERLRPADRKKFFFSIGELDWEEYMRYHIRGLRLHILKDTPDTVDKGRIKYRKLKIAHYTISIVAILLLAWALIAIVRCFIGW
ncbi:fatty acyl-CoA reductase wat [Orussus abietinus]|uniref:fatty acyl-CoA reductase wat n=1 Tax=Orussus abietinus TaxID=222816 RepID=UPI000C715BA9|nr:fatty acyl-CoA reductase wat [Orussus abietinus]